MDTNRDSIMPASSQGLNQVELHPITLSFQGDLEKTFREDYLVNSLRTVRFSLVAGIVIYLVFGILDAVLIPSMKEALWIVRFAVVCPFLFCAVHFCGRLKDGTGISDKICRLL